MRKINIPMTLSSLSGHNASVSMLPIDHIIPELLTTLEAHSTVLLQAPPGAGKTTRVPLALLDSPWRDDRKILMLEPRRLAARSAARFMAKQLGEPVGRRVGYRTRQDTKVSADTRIEVVTEGILTRLIQSDPALEDYAAVLFDEFHERSLQADLGLALVRESQQALREDLRVLVMSATLDTAPLAKLLGNAPVLTSEGRAYPVEVRYRPLQREQRPVEKTVAVVREALAEESGSLLVFLPGVGEIRRVHDALAEHLPNGVRLAPLYGNLKAEEQDQAILPCVEGERKVVLATAIAETSLTIEGVRVVIDAGLQRRAIFDANSGMTRLTTGRVSKASAKQRKGRAGRLEPGVCYRLWSETEQQGLSPFTPAEILEADLAPLVLELAQWGARQPQDLVWLDPPPMAHWRQAVDTLRWLDALDEAGAITSHGESLREFGVHPRLAHMVVMGRAIGAPVLAAEVAALLGERDLLGRDAGADLQQRVRALRGEYKGAGLDRRRLESVRQDARKLIDGKTSDELGMDAVGRLLALAYPDRIARRRTGSSPRYQLSNGRGAALAEEDSLGRETWLVAADLDGQARESRIYLAAALSPGDFELDLSAHIVTEDQADWDEQRGTVVARRVRRLGALILEERPVAVSPELVREALLTAVRRKGLDSLPWSDAARQWRARVTLMRRQQPDAWPELSDDALLADLENWLGPFLNGVSNWAGLQKLDLLSALKTLIDYTAQQALDAQAPVALTIPTGQKVTLDYLAESGPVLAAKLQALFGWTETPRVAGGRVPVVIHLLSPSQRPLAVTSDLASFWRNSYPEVRKDMRGRYPKHPWPEDPLTAEAKQGTKKQQF
ncbi:ATP-dependent helicase HrpB [Hahella sp. NBU794]|uniref:ATP-dependent helicase HrpB n=1 Tax=Hahella sp. NBU794 TaxID=3422590 RepID=UPI003D6FC9E1